MKFGKVDEPENMKFNLPPDHTETKTQLSKYKKSDKPNIYVGCAKWNKADLKGFYPRGIKDELAYYSTQFNSIELNATFYRIFSAEQFASWYEKTPKNFRFFPKLFQGISHWKRLEGTEEFLNEYILNASNLKEKLQMPFLQMPDNFAPKDIDRLEPFLKLFPEDIPLAVELRHTKWYNDATVADELYSILGKNKITNIITDTAGRRDLLHMRMTSDTAFIRYNGANHSSDYTRLDDWVLRLKEWVDQGLQNIYFFIHQNVEKESPLLAVYFIKKLNDTFGMDLQIPEIPT